MSHNSYETGMDGLVWGYSLGGKTSPLILYPKGFGGGHPCRDFVTKSTEVRLRGDLQKINRNRKIGAKLRPPYPPSSDWRKSQADWRCNWSTKARKKPRRFGNVFRYRRVGSLCAIIRSCRFKGGCQLSANSRDSWVHSVAGSYHNYGWTHGHKDT